MDRLTVGEYGQLNRHGDAVRAARTRRERDDAIDVVLYACARFHQRGISWTALAVAIGVTPETLRRWRLRHGPSRKDIGRIDRAATTLELVARASSRFTTSGQSERRLLYTTGHPKPGGNDFASEAAAIRNRIVPYRIDFHEHSCLELGEIPQCHVVQHGSVPPLMGAAGNTRPPSGTEPAGTLGVNPPIVTQEQRQVHVLWPFIAMSHGRGGMPAPGPRHPTCPAGPDEAWAARCAYCERCARSSAPSDG
jgi:hypothetical protein